MRWFVLSVALCLGWPVVAVAAEWEVKFLTVPGGVSAVFLDGDRTIVESRSRAFFSIVAEGAKAVRAERLGAYQEPVMVRRPDMLPDGRVAESDGVIREAYFIKPTSRYRHGVLGDAIEAGGVRVLLENGETSDLTLPSDSVFEDLKPRLHDIDRDGAHELVLVRSSVDAGASVVVAGMRDGQLEIAATAEPIGRPNRWLNPVGVADFDGDGDLEIAIVRTPHIGGILILYRMEGAELVVDHEARGFSNHFIGSRELGMAHIADYNIDGVADIALPNASRDAIRLVSFLGGEFSEISALPLPARVQTALLPVGGEDSGVIAFGLADGALAVLVRK